MLGARPRDRGAVLKDSRVYCFSGTYNRLECRQMHLTTRFTYSENTVKEPTV